MDRINTALAVSLRHLFEELRAEATNGLSALGPPGKRPENVDQKALEKATTRCRQIVLLILASQDTETN
jgi:hypothetical protein